MILLILIGFCALLEVKGQVRVNGIIQDVTGRPIAYANVLLLSPRDSLLIKGSVSEPDGSFYFDKLDKAEYMLSVAMIGYEKYWELITFQVNSQIELPTISLLESGDELEEIQVTAQLPLYEKKIDRMVILAESEDVGTNGNFGLTARMNAKETLGANFNLNHRKNQSAFFVDYSIL